MPMRIECGGPIGLLLVGVAVKRSAPFFNRASRVTRTCTQMPPCTLANLTRFTLLTVS